MNEIKATSTVIMSITILTLSTMNAVIEIGTTNTYTEIESKLGALAQISSYPAAADEIKSVNVIEIMYTEADTEQRGCYYKSLCRRKQRKHEEVRGLWKLPG